MTTSELCQKWQRLSRKYAAPFVGRFPHLADEFLSAANYALFTAARDFPGGGMPWQVWLKVCVHNRCKSVVAIEMNRRSKWFGRQHDIGDVIDYRDQFEEFDRAEQVDHDLAELEPLLHQVNPRDLDALLAFHIDGVGLSEQARRCGRIVGTIWKRTERAKSRIRELAGVA